MELTVETVKPMDKRFEKADDATVQSWINVAKPMIEASGLPDSQLNYGWQLLSAHIGTQLLNRSSNVSSKTMGPLTMSYFDWSDVKTSPFLDLYNDLLSRYGLTLIGKNRVRFY